MITCAVACGEWGKPARLGEGLQFQIADEYDLGRTRRVVLRYSAISPPIMFHGKRIQSPSANRLAATAFSQIWPAFSANPARAAAEAPVVMFATNVSRDVIATSATVSDSIRLASGEFAATPG